MLCQQECSFFFMISPSSIMILLVSIQSTNGIIMICHYEEYRLRGRRVLFTDRCCLHLSAQYLHKSKYVDIQRVVGCVQMCRYSFKTIE